MYFGGLGQLSMHPDRCVENCRPGSTPRTAQCLQLLDENGCWNQLALVRRPDRERLRPASLPGGALRSSVRASRGAACAGFGWQTGRPYQVIQRRSGKATHGKHLIGAADDVTFDALAGASHARI